MSRITVETLRYRRKTTQLMEEVKKNKKQKTGIHSTRALQRPTLICVSNVLSAESVRNKNSVFFTPRCPGTESGKILTLCFLKSSQIVSGAHVVKDVALTVTPEGKVCYALKYGAREVSAWKNINQAVLCCAFICSSSSCSSWTSLLIGYISELVVCFILSIYLFLL